MEFVRCEWSIEYDAVNATQPHVLLGGGFLLPEHRNVVLAQISVIKRSCVQLRSKCILGYAHLHDADFELTSGMELRKRCAGEDSTET